MARYESVAETDAVLARLGRLRQHHDHLKALDNSYDYMRNVETLARMRDPRFRCDPAKMKELDTSYFTSLLIKLAYPAAAVLFENVRPAYERFRDLLAAYDPNADVEIYYDSAHVTIKSLEDGTRQDADALRRYIPVIAPVVRRWLDRLSAETSLYALGLFTNLHRAKGLSIGVRFYPSLPLVQIIRGEVGAALYDSGGDVLLRREAEFHTMLTHSTGFRARNLTFPMSTEFVREFEQALVAWDRTVFGVIHDISTSDIFVRNGYSDRLVIQAEVRMGG